ncbi:phytanoyl-CoA dioxygenase family protein [Verticillium alfalfae VaMs.102]|uniref:Phytanoyl-CoA dioxygenase family protein n=1 Tax=Verticillium alfalfae (strain VaMs.102 / ATCC MYA-4576 / FGSC 10136) TaxID=526221 RepID=C9S8R6_VERA1|nr:phytanoyl-CoA dioxygenase family protein [Verticillium alfalfae VaMs.102]EEY15366.1 phytanoyl-CoA dioxygenase family protein [Verticillium alfalfae VaMs.102]
MSYQPEEPPNNTIINGHTGASAKLYRKPADPETQKLIDHVIESGFVVIENAFGDIEINEALGEVERLSVSTELGGPASAHGRNNFEGFKTRRIYTLINKSRIFDKFAIHPQVEALNNYFLDPGFLLSNFQSINIQPGEEPQTLHHDDAYATLHGHTGRWVLYVGLQRSALVPLLTLLTSHTWGADRIPSRAEAVPVVMPKGSIVYFIGTLWHGGGRNTSNSDRRALTVQYCQPWIRTIENQFLAVDFEKLPDIPKRIVDMLGYQVAAPFIGHVDGMSPRKAAERHLQRWGASNTGHSKL